MKNKIILVSHGNLAKGMKNSVNMIIGNTDNCVDFCLQPGESNIELANKVEDYIKNSGKNVYIIVADLLGGSVSNAVSRLNEINDVFLINGMNSGLVISLLLESEKLNEQKIQNIVEESKKGIGLARLSDDNISNESDII